LKKNLFTIGEISRIKGITAKALRFYDRIGLLKPSSVNPENGYRYYSAEQFIQIDIIRALREIDVSPTEIRTVLAIKNTEKMMEFLDAQRGRIAERIEVLQRMNETITSVQDSVRDSVSSVVHRNPYRKLIAERRILTLPYTGFTDYDGAVMAFSRFDGLIKKYGLSNAYQTGILFEEQEGTSVPSRIFNRVEINKFSDMSATSLLPAGDYVCICYSESNAHQQLAKINRYCAKHKIGSSVILQVEMLNDIFSVTPAMIELQILAGAGR
jgi:DNA-binding transcriptional MerR regulator